MQMMAEQERSDLYIAFAVILCSTNFLCFERYEAQIHEMALSSLSEFVCLISKPYVM